jgi:phosphoglycerol transferase MdoB-like AlkP superfamily enzyme
MSAVGTTLLLALSLHATAAAKEFLVQHRKPFELNFDNLENIVRLSAPMYYAIEAGHLLATERPHNLSPEEMTHMQLWWEHRQAAITAAPLLEHAPAFGSQKGRSLIIIQVEALEETFLGATIANREITPHLNRLAGFELRLSNFRSQVAHGNTADAELAVLTGWHPLPKGAAFFRYPAARHSSLPERLAKHGYASLAYHGNRASFWNRGLVYKTLGFDGFLAKGSLPDGEIIGMGLNDATLLDAMFTDLQAARERRQKLFSFGITLSSHTPFEISPDKVEPEFNAVLPEGMVGNYMRSLHYADNALGQFIERLKTTGIWDDTVVLIYGDHEGIPAHLRNESLPHSIRAAALGNDRRVPAILHLPGTSPTTIDHLVGQIDLMPTILHLLGIPDSTGSKPPVSFGVNAFKRLPRSLVFAAEGRVVRESDGPTEEATREELILSERLLETCNQRPTCGELP